MTATTLPLPIFSDGNVLTHSSEVAFKTCPRKFYLNYRLGLRPAHDSDALRIGSAFHLGLEQLKSGMPEGVAVAAVEAEYASKDVPPWFRDEPDGWDVERETAIAMVRGYARRWAGDLIVKYLAVEQSFNVPIINPESGNRSRTFRSSGKIDGIVELPDGRVAIMEHKTTSEAIEPTADYWQRLMMDSQVTRYVLAAREIGYEVTTTIYDVTRKPTIRPKNITKADRALATANGHYFGFKLTNVCPERETPAMYGARIVADMTERPDFYFGRVEVPRLEADLEEYRWEQWAIAKQIHEADLHGRFYRNTAACLNPYRCQFFDVCRGLSGDPNEQIPDGFKRAERLHGELVTSNGAEQ